MPFITSSFDGARLHYLDYRPTETFPSSHANNSSLTKKTSELTLIFIHGWPYSSLMFDHLMLPLCETHRFRCIGIDRRGFGKSEWNGHESEKQITYGTFASDTVDILKHLELGDFMFIAASMGCGETVLVYDTLPQSYRQQCQGFVWLGPSLPFNLQTESNPKAPPRQLWESIMEGFRQNRFGFTKDALPGVFGVPVGVEVDERIIQRYEQIVHQADSLAIERCVKIMMEKDFTEDLKKLGRQENVKVLLIHGDRDQGEWKDEGRLRTH